MSAGESPCSTTEETHPKMGVAQVGDESTADVQKSIVTKNWISTMSETRMGL